MFEIQSNLEATLNIDIRLTSLNDFNYKKDIVMFGNFPTDSDLRMIEYFLCKKIPFIYNNLWECNPDKNVYSLLSKYQGNGIILNGYNPIKKVDNELRRSFYVPMFFWYNEHCTKAKNKLLPREKNAKKFLLALNNFNIYRNRLFDKLTNELNNSIYSCVFRGKYLPDDAIPLDDRHYNSDWYTNTCFSVVAETDPSHKDLIFITEKTFKPISAGHPFIIHGNPGTLSCLKDNGFKTFDKLFDERYDNIEDPFERLVAIVDEIENFDATKLELIENEVQHNYNLFYDRELVRQRVIEEIEKPIKEFINDR